MDKDRQTNWIWMGIGALLTVPAFLGFLEPTEDWGWRSGYLGFAVLSANFVLLGVLIQLFMSRKRTEEGEGPGVAGATLIMGFLMKIAFVGGITYVALGVYGLDGIGYTVGAMVSLGVIMMSAYLLVWLPQRSANQ